MQKLMIVVRNHNRYSSPHINTNQENEYELHT